MRTLPLLVVALGGMLTGQAPAYGRDRLSGRSAVMGDRTEEVHFRCGDHTLAGTLVLPGTPGPHPAVAFVLGSGPADRTYYGMAPHLWSHFAGHGFACLSWDKPGVGQSTGDYNA